MNRSGSHRGGTTWAGTSHRPEVRVICPSCGWKGRRVRREDRPGGYGVCFNEQCARLGGADRVMRKIEPYHERRAAKAKLELELEEI